MFKLDNELIKDRFNGTSYSFYTDAEIQKLSVKQILNPAVFDHLGNANNGGIYDKALGVSPFNPRSQCVTCGLDHVYCPGHVGHIELTAPVFNPFLINHLYKLLKSKCFDCHRIRINYSKIDYFVQCLKLIKVGHMVDSQVLKNYFMYAAKEVQLLSESSFDESNKKLLQTKAIMDKLTQVEGVNTKVADFSDPQAYFRRIQNTFNNMKQKQELEIIEMFESAMTYRQSEQKSAIFQQTSIYQKTLKELIREIWSEVVPIICPHCKGKTPTFRKDGFTKIFQKPLSEKYRNQSTQQERIKKGSKKSVNIEEDDEGFEIITVASTAGNIQSRKHSGTTAQRASMDDYSQTNLDYEDEQDDEENGAQPFDKQRYLTPLEIKDHIDKMWEKEKELLDIMFGRLYPICEGEQYITDSLGSEMFFLKTIIVPPNRFRPESQGGLGGGGAGQGDKAFLHAHSAMLANILQLNLNLKDALLDKKKEGQEERQISPQSDIALKWIALQEEINTFMDSSMATKTNDKEKQGLRQLLERKEGMFRMKMMGKRVNFGARSVISPDPYITTDQIGVPLFIAKKLTFPESYSTVNADNLRRMVMNGPHQHPGANIIEDEETGQRIYLEAQTHQQRRGLANLLGVGKKIIYRHLQTGDVLLVNRQPTLHKPSIMAHIARILPKEQTIRMHYANCSTYNADFDGDEMNLHFPQNYIACSEAYKLMATHKQYIVPTSGKPIRGLIQDSIVSGVYLSSKDTFLNKEQYQQLVYVGLRELIEDGKLDKIFTLPPAMLKPQPLWTGKQVVSTILKNIVNQEQDNKQAGKTGMNLDSKAKLSAKEWGSIGSEEGDIVIRDNELLQGTIDKNQYGATEFGMVHSFYEIYGSEKAGELLTSLARIFSVYLQMRGFTCGLDDLVLTPEYNKKRRMIIEHSHKEGVEAAAKFAGIKNYIAKPLNYSSRVVFQKGQKPVDKDIKTFTKMALPDDPFEGKQIIQSDDPIRIRIEDKMNSSENTQLLDVEFDNVMKNKMSSATSKILSTCIPEGLLKRFPKNNISAMVLTGAKGGLVNMTQISCLLGQQELEGRRVPKMQNGKTLPCFLPYDPNPRSSGYVSDRFISGLRPQDFYFHCMAGREGLIDTAVKTSRSGYLQRCLIKQLESLIVNYDMTVRDNDGSIIQFLYGEDSIDVVNSKFLEKFNFIEQNFTSLITNYNAKDIMEKVENHSSEAYKLSERKKLKKIKKENPEISDRQLNKVIGDPVISKYHPLKYFGSISEKMDQMLKEYIKNDSQSRAMEEHKGHLIKHKYKPIKDETLRKMYYLKFMKSIVNPGENVGTIAAQSVGEPSTQMTLNTFHLAGHGAGNMTLGVPRLKEILMTMPTHIKTPIMTLQFKKGIDMSKTQMENFANNFKRLKLSDVTKEVKVIQSIECDNAGVCSRVYKVTLLFENAKQLKEQLGIKFVTLAKITSDQYVPLLLQEILKQLKKATGQSNNDPNTQEEVKEAKQKSPKKKQPKKQKSEDIDMEGEDRDEDLEIMATHSNPKSKNQDDDDEEEEDEDEDFNNEIDGVVKKSKEFRGYDQEDEEDKEIIDRSHIVHEDDEDDENIKNHLNVLKERFQKYFGYLRKIESEKDKSLTVFLGFPLECKKILMLTVAEAILSKTMIRSVPGIEKCILVNPQKESDKPYLLVQGLNFDAFFGYKDIVEVNTIQSNDIWQIQKKYGIEAGRANLVKEVKSVFQMYGITVDFRHLSLIADFITFNGEYRAFNRIGMEESSSPFLKMSFETTMKYLVSSCLTKDTDDMSTPSSALVLGLVPKVGTGVFDLLQDPEVYPEA